MALVAAVALAIPWWRWHCLMLEKSHHYMKMAVSYEAQALALESVRAQLAAQRAGVVPAGRSRIRESILSMWIRTYSTEGERAKATAQRFRRAATFPWWDSDLPMRYIR